MHETDHIHIINIAICLSLSVPNSRKLNSRIVINWSGQGHEYFAIGSHGEPHVVGVDVDCTLCSGVQQKILVVGVLVNLGENPDILQRRIFTAVVVHRSMYKDFTGARRNDSGEGEGEGVGKTKGSFPKHSFWHSCPVERTGIGEDRSHRLSVPRHLLPSDNRSCKHHRCRAEKEENAGGSSTSSHSYYCFLAVAAEQRHRVTC